MPVSEIEKLLTLLPIASLAAHYVLCWRKRRRFFAERMAEIDPRWFEFYRRRANRKLWWMVTDETVELYQWSFIRVLWALEEAGVRRSGRIEMSREQAMLMFSLCYYGRIACSYRIPQWDRVEERHVDIYPQMLERLVASFLVNNDHELLDVWVPYFAWSVKQREHIESSDEALKVIVGWAGLPKTTSEHDEPRERARTSMRDEAREMLYRADNAMRERPELERITKLAWLD